MAKQYYCFPTCVQQRHFHPASRHRAICFLLIPTHEVAAMFVDAGSSRRGNEGEEERDFKKPNNTQRHCSAKTCHNIKSSQHNAKTRPVASSPHSLQAGSRKQIRLHVCLRIASSCQCNLLQLFRCKLQVEVNRNYR